MKILAIIPARKGSKRIINKNMRILNGKPLLYYVIQNSIKSQYITDIVVSSDDVDILNYVSKFKVHKRKRPNNLADDQTTLDPVINDALRHIENKLNVQYDIVITLQPTSPLLRSESLDEAIEKFQSDNLDTLISVSDATHLTWVKDGEIFKPNYEKRVNSQWLRKIYKENGAFLITKAKFVNPFNRLGIKISVYHLNEKEAIDIDSPIDWMISEALMKILRIGFVVVGGSKTGLGHIYRCLSLADSFLGNEIYFLYLNASSRGVEMIRERHSNIIPIEESELIDSIKKLNLNILINDKLDTSKEYIGMLHNLGLFIVNFEDLGTGAENSHLTFNALYEKSNPPKHHRFGSNYVCLSPNFALTQPIEFQDNPTHLVVTFGGVDQNNLTTKVLKALPKVFEQTTITQATIILGLGFDHHKELFSEFKKMTRKNAAKITFLKDVKNMVEVLKRADLAITSNGRTVYELSSLGIPTISISQNDRETLHLYSRYQEGIRYLGIACNINRELMESAINEICNNNNLRKCMYEAQITSSKIIKSGLIRVKEEILYEYWIWKRKFED